MPQSLEHQPEHQYEANGVTEALSSQEEGNGPPCPGCGQPTTIKNGRFFCTNKAKAVDNSFQCPLQTSDSGQEVTQYLPEEIKQKALAEEVKTFPNDEAEPEERDFSFPDEEQPVETPISAIPAETSPFDLEISDRDLDAAGNNLDEQAVLRAAGVQTWEEFKELPPEKQGLALDQVSRQRAA